MPSFPPSLTQLTNPQAKQDRQPAAQPQIWVRIPCPRPRPPALLLGSPIACRLPPAACHSPSRPKRPSSLLGCSTRRHTANRPPSRVRRGKVSCSSKQQANKQALSRTPDPTRLPSPLPHSITDHTDHTDHSRQRRRASLRVCESDLTELQCKDTRPSTARPAVAKVCPPARHRQKHTENSTHTDTAPPKTDTGTHSSQPTAPAASTQPARGFQAKKRGTRARAGRERKGQNETRQTHATDGALQLCAPAATRNTLQPAAASGPTAGCGLVAR